MTRLHQLTSDFCTNHGREWRMRLGIGVNGKAAVWAFTLLLTAVGGGGIAIGGDFDRTQTIALEEGWNSIFLEVQPEERDPSKLFAGLPVDIVASFYAPPRPTQFVSDPEADLFREAGWGVWYAPDRPDTFLTTLFAIYGARAYLIHAEADFEWDPVGAVMMEPIQWRPDSFNLVGFGVDRLAPPTFAQFFEGSSVHGVDRIYRLNEGRWKRVTDPAEAVMRSGEAFWIYCEGASDYQGPLRVTTMLRHGLVPSEREDTLKFRNLTGHPIVPTLEHVPTNNEPVPLSLVIQTTDPEPVGAIASMTRYVSVPQPAGSWEFTFPPLEAGAGMGVPMEARIEEMTSYFHSSLLKISTDLGTEQWVPVSTLRQDLKPE